MVVHFIGSKSNILEEMPYYRLIVSQIKEQGHTLARDWIDEIYSLAQKGQLKKAADSWSKVDKDNSAALSKADVIIVDATAKSFFSGYQVAHAVAQKKPILILTREDSPVGIAGLSTPTGFIKSMVYNEENVGSIIQDFLDENIVDTKDLRFNFFLDRQTYNYLRWMSSKTGKTKAQIVRSLLQKEMNKNNDES